MSRSERQPRPARLNLPSTSGSEQRARLRVGPRAALALVAIGVATDRQGRAHRASGTRSLTRKCLLCKDDKASKHVERGS